MFFRKRSLRSCLLQHFIVAAALVLAAATGQLSADAAESGVNIPAPAFDLPQTPDGKLQTAVLAGGCFWGVQAVFQHTKGVESAISGYSGGDQATAHYETVSSGRTGHAESVKIVFDPRIISYGQILRIFFAVAHDPTQRDRQGPDVGTQYRSAIFSGDDSQSTVATTYIAQLDQAHAFSQSIATRIEPLKAFYPAERHHQDYLVNPPNNPYIVFNDQPKLGRSNPLTTRARNFGYRYTSLASRTGR
jgi:peptide-methionine (S)-S-oxide reductase